MLSGFILHLLRKHKITIVVLLLLSLCYFGGEAWQLAPTNEEWDWFYGVDKKISAAWVVKDFSEEIIHIVLAVLLLIGFFRHKRLVINIALVAYLTYRVFDLGMWIWDYKTGEMYYTVYYAALVIEASIWAWVKIRK